MNKYILTASFTLCALLLSACSTSSHHGVFIPISAGPDKTAVYIYRPSAVSNAMYSPDLYVNDEYTVSIKNGNKARLTLEPGNSTFELEPGSDYKGLTKISMFLSAGRTYYIRVDTSLKINSSSNFEPYHRNFNLIKVETPLAVEQIAGCCLSENNLPATEAVVEEKEQDGQFSVDKTQNPFSH